MPAFEYSKERTLFHRLSPAVKCGWGALILVWLFVIPNPLHMFIFGMVIFAQAVIGAGIPPLRLIKTIFLIGIASGFIVVFQGLLYPGATILFTLGPFHPTVEGISFGLTIGLRVLSIVAASLTISRTTDPHDIVLTLVKAGLPYKIAYGLFVALRFVPLMEYEAQNINAAQYVRGITKKEGGIGNSLKGMTNFLIPFIAIGIRRADQAAIAMESRAFGLYPTRTYLRELSFPKAGRIFLVLWCLAFVVYELTMSTSFMAAINFSLPH